MPTATTSRVPDGLTFDPVEDPKRNRHLVLAMPHGARVVDEHESHAGAVLERGDVHVDRGLLESGLSVNVDHRPKRNAGSIVDAVVDDEGVWTVVDLNAEGERVLASGEGHVSAELIQPQFKWLLSGLALLSRGEQPGIPGSKVVFDQRRYSVFAASPPLAYDARARVGDRREGMSFMAAAADELAAAQSDREAAFAAQLDASEHREFYDEHAPAGFGRIASVLFGASAAAGTRLVFRRDEEGTGFQIGPDPSQVPPNQLAQLGGGPPARVPFRGDPDE